MYSARRFLKPLLAELSDWRDATRIHAANLLRSCIVYLEEHITIHLHKLVGTLCRCAKGMSEEWSKECTGLVARFVPTDSLVDLVLPIVREDPDGAKGKFARLFNSHSSPVNTPVHSCCEN